MELPKTVSYIEAFSEGFNVAMGFWDNNHKNPKDFEEIATVAAIAIAYVASEERKAIQVRAKYLGEPVPSKAKKNSS